MARDARDPAVIRSVAVTADDVLAALEARRQRGEQVVLRVTPPFSGRMRARLHVPSDGAADPGTLHLAPETFLGADAPPYPRPAETGDELRADPTVERHHDRHLEAVEGWRGNVRDHFVERIDIETADGVHTVDVTVLG